VNAGVLCLFVAFVADEDEGEGGWAVGFGFFEPLGDVEEAVAIGDVVDDDGSDCVAVVPSSDGLEALLSGLYKRILTVSQICNFMLFSLTFSILAPNYTPMVTSCFSRYRLSVYCRSMQLLPTPAWEGRYRSRRL
jgi:hypothetical protein